MLRSAGAVPAGESDVRDAAHRSRHAGLRRGHWRGPVRYGSRPGLAGGELLEGLLSGPGADRHGPRPGRVREPGVSGRQGVGGRPPFRGDETLPRRDGGRPGHFFRSVAAAEGPVGAWLHPPRSSGRRTCGSTPKRPRASGWWRCWRFHRSNNPTESTGRKHASPCPRESCSSPASSPSRPCGASSPTSRRRPASSRGRRPADHRRRPADDRLGRPPPARAGGRRPRHPARLLPRRRWPRCPVPDGRPGRARPEGPARPARVLRHAAAAGREATARTTSRSSPRSTTPRALRATRSWRMARRYRDERGRRDRPRLRPRRHLGRRRRRGAGAARRGLPRLDRQLRPRRGRARPSRPGPSWC